MTKTINRKKDGSDALDLLMKVDFTRPEEACKLDWETVIQAVVITEAHEFALAIANHDEAIKKWDDVLSVCDKESGITLIYNMYRFSKGANVMRNRILSKLAPPAAIDCYLEDVSEYTVLGDDGEPHKVANDILRGSMAFVAELDIRKLDEISFPVWIACMVKNSILFPKRLAKMLIQKNDQASLYKVMYLIGEESCSKTFVKELFRLDRDYDFMSMVEALSYLHKYRKEE